ESCLRGREGGGQGLRSEEAPRRRAGRGHHEGRGGAREDARGASERSRRRLGEAGGEGPRRTGSRPQGRGDDGGVDDAQRGGGSGRGGARGRWQAMIGRSAKGVDVLASALCAYAGGRRGEVDDGTKPKPLTLPELVLCDDSPAELLLTWVDK